MCGIAGIMDLNEAPVLEPDVRRMTDLLAHRGPDGEGIFLDGHVGLGHRRLAIIDLSSAAQQPMANENGTVWLVFNGEIYNYRGLVPLLQQKGHRFKSRSDSEVILHAYEEWGVDCVQRFNGMWAFAIWDAQRRRLFLSRDRFGVKPLYYYRSRSRFYFASEIKALLAVVPEARQPNYSYLYPFLNSGLLDHGEETFFRDVKQLLPAHCLVVEASSGPGKGAGESLHRYWDYDPAVVQNRYDFDHPEKVFRDLLEDAVRLRLLRSDVPVGTCLSGGLDSSAIVALSSRMTAEPVKTFSCLYADPDSNEQPFVDAVNRDCRTEAYPVRPTGKDLFDVLPQLVWHQDEPTAAPGEYSQWHVMKAARGKVKVLLDGQGGDELLGGYLTYFDTYLSCLLNDVKKSGSLGLLRSYCHAVQDIARLTGQPYVGRELQRWLPRSVRRLVARAWGLARRVAIGPLAGAPPVLHPDFVRQVSGCWSHRDDPPRRFDDELNDLLYRHLVRDSIPALLHYEDRNSMAFSIEARTPFLDYRLVEYCFGLSYHWKIRGATNKYLLRQALRDVLPREVVERKDKKGYPTPMGTWLRDEQEPMKDILLSAKLKQRGILNPAGIERMIRLHCSGSVDASWVLYRWLTTELWFRTFLD